MKSINPLAVMVLAILGVVAIMGLYLTYDLITRIPQIRTQEQIAIYTAQILVISNPMSAALGSIATLLATTTKRAQDSSEGDNDEKPNP